jgi:hypothetical protein
VVVLFIAGTAALIVLSARTQSDLVSPDYYERELRYEEDISRRARTLALAGRVRVAHDADQRRLTLALPVEHAARHAEGEIHLYRPSAAGQDRHIRLELDAHGRQTVDTGALSAGLWRVRVTWRVGDEDFAVDERMVIGQPKSS